MKNVAKELDIVKYTAAAVKVLQFKCESDFTCFALHWHDRLEIIKVKKGSMKIELGGKTLMLNTNQMVIFPPRMAHKGYTENENVEYDVLMFDVRSFYNEAPICTLTLPLILEGRVKFQNIISDIETINICDKICYNKNPDSLEIISLVYKLLFVLFDKHLSEIGPKTHDKSSAMINYIEKNYTQDLNTTVLSKNFGYSSEHFCRKFKEATGITPMTYLKIYRLEQSVKMLKLNELSISEIAAQCGFNDANYFTRCFKAHYGVSPKKFKINQLTTL